MRIASMRALEGRLDELLEAARGNANDAMAAGGCRSAEVCLDADVPGGILVVSRWESRAALEAFLAWHETIAHASLADFSDAKPRAVHHVVVAAGA